MIHLYEDFEWDEAKSASNLVKHGIDFTMAAKVLLGDPHVTETKPGNDTARFLAIGESDGRYYTVIYTLRGSLCRIISVRRANHVERKKLGAL